MGDCLLSGQMWRTRLFCVYVTGMQVLVVKRSNLLELVLTFKWQRKERVKGSCLGTLQQLFRKE